jgi:hypothetical protein
VHVLTGTVDPPAPGKQPHVLNECFDSGERDWKNRRDVSEIIQNSCKATIRLRPDLSVEGMRMNAYQKEETGM